MRHPLCSLACLALAWAAFADDPDPEPNPFAVGWDKPIDPDKDCTFKREKGGLTITLPGRHHDLNVGSGKMNAPRLLRDVEGDFVAEVRVGGKFATSAASSVAGPDGPRVSAGLVVMASEKTYATLQRLSMRDRPGGKESSAGLLTLWRDGGHGLGRGISVRPKEAYLRLERKGDRLLASFSQDGKGWHTYDPLDVKLPAKVKLGVVALSSSTDPFAPHFSGFKLVKKGKPD